MTSPLAGWSGCCRGAGPRSAAAGAVLGAIVALPAAKLGESSDRAGEQHARHQVKQDSPLA